MSISGIPKRLCSNLTKPNSDITMRFMILVKATKDSEAGFVPNEQTKQMLTEMGKFNDELVKAGILLAADGLHPSSKGARVRFSGAKRTVTDGPFIETRSWSRASGSGSASRCKRRLIGSSVAPIPCRENRRSKFARCSRRRI